MTDDRLPTRETLRELVGRQIIAVRYIELRDDEPHWQAQGFHALDYGLEWDLDNGSTWSVAWLLPGWQEGLEVYRGRLSEVLRADAEVATWDVSFTGSADNLAVFFTRAAAAEVDLYGMPKSRP